ncbi:MAG: TIGR02300 family protein [Pseudomonadota bacterium]
MPKDEWGVKRLCAACGARFYDLQRDPVDCPKCGATYAPAEATATKGKVTKATAAAKVAAADDEDEEELEVVEEVDDDEDDADEVVIDADDDDDDDDEAEATVLLDEDDDSDDDDALGEFASVDDEEKDT